MPSKTIFWLLLHWGEMVAIAPSFSLYILSRKEEKQEDFLLLRLYCLISKEKLSSRCLLMSHYTECGYVPTGRLTAGKEEGITMVV